LPPHSRQNTRGSFAAQTYQIRVVSILPIWATIGSTAVVTANSAATFLPGNWPEYFAVTSGQVLNFISTSTSSGYLVDLGMATARVPSRQRWPDHPSEEQKSSAHPKDDEKLKDKIGGQHCSFRDATWSERFALVLV